MGGSVSFLANEHLKPAEIPMAPFPFERAILRAGEPERPAQNTPINIFRLEELNLDSQRTWLLWAYEQPDHLLLVEDFFERSSWAIAKGIPKTPTLVDELRAKRYAYAQQIRTEGNGTLLDTYWPNNQELRQPPETNSPPSSTS